MTITVGSAIGEVVSADFRAAAVFSRYGIAFCCGGKRTIAAACRDGGVSAEDVVKALQQACASKADVPRFAEWEPDRLASYIVAHHHAYVRRALPAITTHTSKVASVHGGRHPELEEVARIWKAVAEEMSMHMAKEERMLFPYIAQLASAARLGEAPPPAPFGPLENPIRMMEAEHDSAGDAMARIRRLTNGYAPPADACTTYRICFQELEEFEQDLHVHVHLENNLLFPKARTLAAASICPSSLLYDRPHDLSRGTR